jgi:hypothetical protein
MTEPSAIRRPLTRELEDAGSPVRQFLDARFTSGLRDAQRRYRESAPPLAVPGVPRADADAGTVGTAADWLLRFLICPQPDLYLVIGGAAAGRKAGIDVASALAGIAGALGVPLPARPPERVRVFTGPVPGSDADPGLLARSCWALALLTEAFRAGPVIAARWAGSGAAGYPVTTCSGSRRRPGSPSSPRSGTYSRPPSCRSSPPGPGRGRSGRRSPARS